MLVFSEGSKNRSQSCPLSKEEGNEEVLANVKSNIMIKTTMEGSYS
jgi:hypothetical protein